MHAEGGKQEDVEGDGNDDDQMFYISNIAENLEAHAVLTDPKYGTAQVEGETRPTNMSVVWIIRVK